MNKKNNIQGFFEDLEKNSKKIIIFGAGGLLEQCIREVNFFLQVLCDNWKTPKYIQEYGKYDYNFMKMEEYIEFIVDNDVKKSSLNNWVLGSGKEIRIHSANVLESIDPDKYVILISTKRYEKEIKDQLKEIENLQKVDYYSYFTDLHHYDKKNRGLIVERVILPYLGTMHDPYYKKNIQEDSYAVEYERLLKNIELGNYVMNIIAFEITTVCNLKCEYCTEYVPYLPEKRHFEVERVMRDIDTFLSVVDLVFCVTLTTGEVLFYPELKQILNKLIKNDKIERIDLVTNGFAVPKDEELLKLLTNPKIMLNMSNYNIPDKTQPHREYYLEHGIDFRYMDNQTWDTSFGEKPRFDKEWSRDELENKYMCCGMAKYCSQLISDERIYACGKIRRFLQISEFQTQHDYLFMERTEKLKQKLIDFKLESYMEGCAWCPMYSGNSKKTTPGKQIMEKH